MPSTILSDNGVTSGTAGIKTTGSNDGQLALQTTTAGGTATTALTIDTSQNVGIGTSSPLAKLNVQGASTAKALFNVTGYGGLEIGHNADFTAEINQKSGQALLFKTDAAERMRIDSNGNVLVGDSSADYYAAGRGNIEINGSSNSILALKIGAAPASYFYASASDLSIVNTLNGIIGFYTNSTERARITSGGEFLVNGLTNQGYIASRKLIAVSAGATITLDGGFGSHLYVSTGSGSSAVFWAPYGGATTLLNSSGDPSFSATDSGTAVRVYKSNNTVNVTLKNSTGSLQNVYVLAITGY